MKSLIPDFERIRARYPKDPEFQSSLVLPLLRRIQQERGYIADEDIAFLAEYLAVPRIQIEEVLSYYTQYRRKPIGRHHVEVCRNVSCSMRGAERLIGHLCKRLGIEEGQTTPDGRITLATAECLGSCGTAPVVVVDNEYHENMSPEKIDQLLGELK